ncbi:hypothetical protein BH11PSE12_BH11PSE12_00280 [soil metagenome]
MMKIVFVENRYFTWILDAVAKELLAADYEIHWIVQNPMFIPKHGQIHLLSFPKHGAKEKLSDAALAKRLHESDRGVRWFGGDGSHWAIYRYQINEIIQALMPDVVFSETTEFHELLTLDVCKQHGIPLLSPNVTRYPVGRLNFFLNDTLNPIGGEGKDLTDQEVDQMLTAIVERTIRPSYMEPVQHTKLQALKHQLNDKVRILTGWFKGERFVTPSPWVKMLLEREHAKQYKYWESFAHRTLPDSIQARPCVLFPLQMQPESNIEVWGSPWSDQVDIVKRAAKALAQIGAVLVVKPNPKSKYELNAELCDVVANTPNVIAISHTTPMKSIFDQIPLVMTVTGTVLMECIFAGKPIASLGNHAMTLYPGVLVLNAPEEILEKLQMVLRNEVAGASRQDAKQLLNFLHKTSYPAMIWDPYRRPELMTKENLLRLNAAFVNIFLKLQESYFLMKPGVKDGR